MIITDFTRNHIEEALNLAKSNFDEERSHMPVLPSVGILPPLTGFAENNLGAAALENGELIGFLCFYKPWDNVFTTNARGTFSPVHAHGAVCENREMIYKRMYEIAAKKLVQQGISIHTIGLYAHDLKAINAFYTYGFGLRCVDAISPMEKIKYFPNDDYSFHEIASNEKKKLLPLKNMLIDHLSKSPMFMYYPPESESGLEKIHNRRQSRYFCAFQGNNIVAYIEIMDSGENFVCDDSSMKNICGAYCLTEHRGKGITQNLLNFIITILKSEGYTRLGVDFESFNPTAYGFWLKHFTAYTNSVVRRIDERILHINGYTATAL